MLLINAGKMLFIGFLVHIVTTIGHSKAGATGKKFFTPDMHRFMGRVNELWIDERVQGSGFRVQ
jgi:hypothetical protein